MGCGINPRRRGEPCRYKMHAPREAFCISFLLSAFNFLLLFPCGEPRRYNRPEREAGMDGMDAMDRMDANAQRREALCISFLLSTFCFLLFFPGRIPHNQ